MTVLGPELCRLADKVGWRSQVAALPWRARKDRVQVLLVTSRDTGRWVLPKGWPIPLLAAPRAAAREAWEEGGVRGRLSKRPLGVYTYLKRRERGGDLPCTVEVFALRVEAISATWPEADERLRRWMSPRKAAARVAEPDLAALIAGFDPRRLPL